MRIAAALIGSACVFWGAAWAEPGGTSSVSGPGIREGQLKAEARTTAFDGGAIDGAWSHRAQIGYGFTDWYRAQLNFRGAQPDGDDAELRSIGIENTFDFTATRDWPVHLGGQFEYRFGVNDADDSIELKLLAESNIAGGVARFNLVGERPIGADSEEWEHGYGARLMWDVSDTLELGFEGLGELDIDAHAWGPRGAFSFGDAAITAAYLFSSGDDSEADGQLRLALEWVL